jgi:signal transduction histidine kinase
VLRGLGAKLALLLIVAGVVPVLTAGVVANLLARDTASAAVRDGNRQLALRAARQIGQLTIHAQEVVQGFGAAYPRGAISTAHELEHEQRMLIGLKLQLPVLANLMRVDAAGAPVVWTDVQAPAPLAAGDPALHGTPSASAVTTGADLIPQMRITLPLRAGGAMVATLDLVELWSIVDEIRVGRTGRVVLLDAGGAVIAHGDPRGKAMALRGEPLVQLAAAARAAAGNGTVLEGAGSLGQPALSVAVTVPHTPWVLLLEQDEAEAFAGVRRLSWLLAGLAVAVALLAAVAGLRLARRRVLAPVRALETAAAAYGQQRFDHRVVLQTNDELEELGRAFNAMAERIDVAHRELQRTAHARALGLLAGGLLHDLKHPVAAFQALLLRAERLGPDLDRRLADTARRETPRLAALVDQLGDLGRAGARRDTEFTAASLADVAEGFRERGATIAVEVPDPSVRLRADKQMLSRAIENLLANALEASPPGGTIRLGITKGAESLEISVEDDGPGPPPGVFEDFASTKPHGLGLGLTVVREVVRAHGGGIDVTGSRFVIRLPGSILS